MNNPREQIEAAARTIRDVLDNLEYTMPEDPVEQAVQTDLSVSDNYASCPELYLENAFCIFAGEAFEFVVNPDDIKNIKHLFPDDALLKIKEPTRFRDVVWRYFDRYCRKYSKSFTYYATTMYHSFDLPAICEIFKKKSPLLRSTLPAVYYQYKRTKTFSFDIVRELKQYRSKLNGLDYDVTDYYLFLESQGIPMAAILANPRVKAQVGLEFNFNHTHHCPEILKILESPIIKQLEIMAEGVTSDIIEKIKSRIVSIAVTIYNLSRWSMSKMSTTDLIVNLTATLAICIPVTTMSEMFKRVFSPISQSSETEKLVLLVKAFFLCLFVLIVGKLPGKGTIDEFLNRIRIFPQAFESVQKFWKQIDPITKTATDFIESDLLGYDIIKEKTIMDEVDQWAKRVQEYTDLHKKREIARSKETMLAAGKLHVDGVRLLSKCIRMHYSRENVELVRSLLPTTYKISELAIRSGADHAKPRREPLVIWFCGESGVGKSTMTYPFLCDMMKSELGPNEELPENWVQNIYARAPECEFFDGDPTDWIVYDDGFQIRDSIANPSPELFEIIRLGNMFPYMYHKASIEEKGNCFAEVKGIVISSNIDRIVAESLHCPEAVARRIRHAYRVRIKKEFRLQYIGVDNKPHYRLDTSKLSGPSLDVYEFEPFDPHTGIKLGRAVPYRNMLMQCAMSLRKMGEDFVAYDRWLDDYRKKPFVSCVAQAGDCEPSSNGVTGSKDEMMNRYIERLLSVEKSLREGRPFAKNDCLFLDYVKWLSIEKKRELIHTMFCLTGRDFSEFISPKKERKQWIDIFHAPQIDEEAYEELMRTIDENGFFGYGQRVKISDQCEVIKPFNFFAVSPTFNQWLVTKFLRRKLGDRVPDMELFPSIVKSIKSDLDIVRRFELRSLAVSMYAAGKSMLNVPYAMEQLYTLAMWDIFEKEGAQLWGNGKYANKYRNWCKTQADRRMMFADADFVFRTRVPYVQTGVEIEEVNDEDVSRVEKAIRKYKLRCKKVVKEAWAYTRANWQNLLLWTVGTVIFAKTVYNAFQPAIEEDEENLVTAQISTDESGTKTQARPRARVQNSLDESGTRQTKHRQNRPRVQSNEADLGPVKVETLRPDWQQAKPQAQGNNFSAIDHQLYNVLDSRVYANTLIAYITPRGEDRVHRRLGHVIALKGSLFMMNYHFVMVMKQYADYDVIFRQGNMIYHRCGTEELLSRYVRVAKRDLVVFEMVRKGIAFGDLVKHIQTKSMSYSFNVQHTLLARCRLDGFSVSPNLLNSTDAYLSVSPLAIELDLRGETTEIVNSESWFYTGVTHQGDCGALLLISNNRVPSKIIGVHNAFDPCSCKGIAVPLYREEIEEAMAFFRPRLQYGWREDHPIIVPALKFNQGENFNVVRCEEGSVPACSKSRLAKSPIFERLVPTLTKPGYLKPFSNDAGELVDPARIARAKWGYHLPRQDKLQTQRVSEAMCQIFMRKGLRDHDRYRYPLTTEEAIVGIDGIEGLNSINKVSSPGYPYVFEKIPGRGKTGYFGTYDFDLSLPGAQKVIREVTQMEVDIISNVRPFVVWIDTLKDARIPIAKANKGKTRIFSAGPMAYTILYRKYFLPCIAHVMANRIDNYIAVGINPTSPEWHSLSLKMKSKGPHCVAGDYACFDGKAPTEGYLTFLDFVQNWYSEHWDDVTSHNCHVVENYQMSQSEFLYEFLPKIFLEVVNHIHLMEEEIDGKKHRLFYSVCNGQPSGNPGTAVVNSFQGLYMALMCWLELTKGTVYCTTAAFFENVYFIDYGDDVAMNISSSVIHLYNQNTLTRMMKRLFDIEFTDEKKTGDEVPDYRELSEITFLKRGFVFSEEIQMYVSPMDVENILDTCNWVRTGAEDARVITINNLSSAAAELALHPEHVYQEWIPKIKKLYSELAWRVNMTVVFDTRLGYLFAFRNANFKAIESPPI